MKKVIFIVVILLLGFFGLLYWSVSSTDKKFDTCVIEDFEDLEKTNFKDHDSVVIAPSSLYEGDILKEFMQGKNYRKTWATKVKVPIVFLDTLLGGMEVVKKGGGKQTHSLKLKSKNGVMYSLRSVTKDPKKLIPEVAEDLGLENIIVDGISAQHPYGAILAASLADQAGILHTHPKMYFVPKQTALGKYNKKFGNRLYLLEYETESDKNWTDFENVRDIIETKDLQELKMKEAEKVSIDKDALIKVRLFDLLIGDWDRHAEQWGWIMIEQNDELIGVPLAGDRDNAFFSLSGVIPSILTSKNIEPLVRPFEKDIDYLPGLVYPFDRYFLLNTPQQNFIDQAKILQKELSDEAIEKSFEAWPDQISDLDKREIQDKIVSRRDKLQEYARSFHQIIQDKGELTEALKGSEKLELSKDLLACFDCKN